MDIKDIVVDDLDHGTFQASSILFERMKKRGSIINENDEEMFIDVSTRAGMTRVAGKAFLKKGAIRYSKEYFEHATASAKLTVIIHEVCHLYAWKYYKCADHGYSWQDLMRLMGLVPERCWTKSDLEDTDEAKKAFSRAKIGVKCSGCGFVHNISKNLATRLSNGTSRKVCGKCKTRLR